MAVSPPPATFNPRTMGRPEDGNGLPRHRVENGPTPPSGSVVVTAAERPGGSAYAHGLHLLRFPIPTASTIMRSASRPPCAAINEQGAEMPDGTLARTDADDPDGQRVIEMYEQSEDTENRQDVHTTVAEQRGTHSRRSFA
jgi:hypothetical protein